MTQPLPEEELARLEALEKAATPGPWHRIWYGDLGPGGGAYRDTDLPWPKEKETIYFDAAEEDLICASRNALPAILSELRRLRAENERLTAWVADLQSGMFVNCVYCGHRYGPREDTPSTMAEILKTHVEQCPKHPMSALKAQLSRREAMWEGLRTMLDLAIALTPDGERAKTIYQNVRAEIQQLDAPEGQEPK